MTLETQVGQGYAETVCDDCGGTGKVDSMTEIGVIGGYLDCGRCQSTGKKYHWLWEKCGCKCEHCGEAGVTYNPFYASNDEPSHLPCEHGTGYVLNVTLEGLLKVAREENWLHWISYTASQYHVEIMDKTASADTLLEALDSALRKALGVTLPDG